MTKPFPKLHIFLGAGGVGKTTLSTAFALSLANSGKNVGLISIDPAKRLQSALGIERISEVGITIPLAHNQSGGILRAAVLDIGESLTRWIEEKGMPPEQQEKLFSNPYFSALADKMASAAETFAAIRVTEWLEQYPDTEELVIDTAPGVHAIDFIVKPEKVTAFLDSKLVDWLKWFSNPTAEKQNFIARALKSGARKVLDGLAMVGGRNFLVNFGEFLILLDEVVVTALARLQTAQQWLKHPSTNLVLVGSIREDAAHVAKELGKVLNSLDMMPRLAILNRSFPATLKNDPSFQNWLQTSHLPTEELFANYMMSYAAIQEKVLLELSSFARSVIEIPISVNLDVEQELRLTDLTMLGEKIRAAF